jgi:Family of unknown function (DUF5677)
MRAAEIRKVQTYVNFAKSEIRRMRICPRVANRFPFDILGLATLSKVFALSNASLTLLRASLPDEAFGLSRSIVECATDLRYLTADPTLQDRRSRDFGNYALADKSFWAHYALEQFKGKKEEKEIREYAKQQGIVPDTKPARRHWSGLTGFIWDVMNIDHPLDGPVTAQHKKVSYAADYFQTSSYVHCSLPAIDNYCPEESTPFEVSGSSLLRETCQSTLFITLIYVHSSIAYVLFGMGLDRPAKFNSLFQSTLGKMKPVPRRHSP